MRSALYLHGALPQKTLYCVMETPLDRGDLTENTVLQNLQTEAKILTRSVD